LNYKKLLTALLLASLAAGTGVLVTMFRSDPGFHMWEVKLAWSSAQAVELTQRGTEWHQTVRESLAWDHFFIAIYVLFLWVALRLVVDRAGPGNEKAVLPKSWLTWLPLMAGLFDIAENRAIREILAGSTDPWVVRLKCLATLATWATVLAIIVVLVRGWRRAAQLADAPEQKVGVDPSRVTLDKLISLERAVLDKRGDQKTVGLAFSGGGIRAGTFDLGILQALARMGLLDRLDYISTISGGGYIGAWLHQWIRHRGLDEVVEELARDPDELKPEPAPITHLRNYSNYLTPKLGFLSADTWATVATYVRNMLLNLVIIVGLAGTLLMLPRAVADSLGSLEGIFTRTKLESLDSIELGIFTLDVRIGYLWAFLAFFALFLTSIIGVGVSLAGAVTASSKHDDGLTSQGAVQRNTIIPVVAACVFGAYWLWVIDGAPRSWFLVLTPFLYALPWVVSAGVVYLVAESGSTASGSSSGRPQPAASMRQKLRQYAPEVLSVWLPPVVAVGVALGLALWGLTHLFSGWSQWQLIAFGPPISMGLFTLTAVLHIGLLGRHFNDHLREWLARAGAWIMIYSLAWLALNGLTIYGPVLLAAAHGWVKAGMASGWLAVSAWGALAGNAQQQGAGKRWHGPALRIAPWIFIVGLAVTLSWSLDRLLSRNHEALWDDFADVTSNPKGGETLEYQDGALAVTIEKNRALGVSDKGKLGTLAESHDKLLDAQLEDNEFWLWMLGLALVALEFSRRVDVNEFSMHQYYRNRLVRAYLGASNPERKPNPFTGFDPADDGKLGIDFDDSDLEAGEGIKSSRPLHLIGAALNLVHGTRLGWQERKAASFVFTPYYSGFALPADQGDDKPQATFRRTHEVDRLTLGTAMAISGAAASPNMGFRSTPALTLLLTVFNVRLGWWLGNPGQEEAWKRGGPRVALVPLIAELFGLTSDRSANIYLSDGGHFENLGIYELVRRRCRFIIVTDASADPKLEFSDLGNAIRKCRTDFGAEIEINIEPIRVGESGLSRRHCAVGKIRYAAKTKGGSPETGYLLYIKPTMTGDEPEDVQQYAEASTSFPHQSTADQFFDESQFESYRALGEHIGRRVFTSASSQVPGQFRSWESLFTEVRERWTPPSRSVERSFSKHGAALDTIFQRMGDDQQALDFLDAEIYPEWEILSGKAGDPGWPYKEAQIRSGFYLCSSIIQLMENVYLDLRLDDEHRHPDNRGWMNLFKQWAAANMMKGTWAVSAGNYGSRFQTFCRRRLHLHRGSVSASIVQQDYMAEILAEWKEVGVQTGKRVTQAQERAQTSEPGAIGHSWIAIHLEAEGPPLNLPIGFALTERQRAADGSSQEHLLYFQVPKHLRNTGLAQQGLYEIARKFMGIAPIEESLKLQGVPLKTWRAFVSLYEMSIS